MPYQEPDRPATGGNPPTNQELEITPEMIDAALGVVTHHSELSGEIAAHAVRPAILSALDAALRARAQNARPGA
jgi:hypothetical protein